MLLQRIASRASRIGTTRGYKSVNPLYAHDEPNPYADYSREPESYTFAWKALVGTAAAVFVYDNSFDTTRPTQTHLMVFGHGSPI
jgi:hypothetical protein